MVSKNKYFICAIFAFFILFFNTHIAYSATEPTAVISMYPQDNISTTTTVTLSADNSIPSDGAEITSVSWGGDYSFTGLYTAGTHTVTLTVTDSNGLTSAPASVTFVVVEPASTDPPVAVITMTPNTNITDETDITWSYLYSHTYNNYIANAEWENKESRYDIGYHTVRLRIQDGLGYWSDWVETTFYVADAGDPTYIPTGDNYVYSLIESSGKPTKTISETRMFDLTELSFTVRYGNDTTKTLSVYDLDISIDSKYRDIAYVTSNNRLYFYNDVEYDDYANVNFSYTERNKTVKTSVKFIYTRSSSIGLINNMTTNVSEVLIPRDEVFYFKDILFHVTYENGYEENLDGTKVNYEFSAEFKKYFYIDESDTEDGVKITPMLDATVNDSGFVEFSLKTDSFYENIDPNIPIKTFKKYIKFIVVDEEDEYITENSIQYISALDTVVGISDNEKLQIPSLDFVAHLYNGQMRKLSYSNFTLNIQYKYKQLIEYDESAQTIMFKPSTPYGTEIVLNFVYNKTDSTKAVDVKVIYTESSPNHGSSITPLFTDISGHWAQNDIIQMALKNKVVGFNGNLYYPNRYVTRAEVASFISKYLELNKKENKDLDLAQFIDVPSYDNSYSDIVKVYAAGIFNGYEDGSFLPDALITRQELAVVLYRTYQYKTGLALSGNNTLPFIDDGAISGWARDYIYSAKAIGLIQGREDGKFYPYDNTTRAEITAILNRMLNN